MPKLSSHISGAVALIFLALPASAQQASFVHRLGRDTIAVEQFTRTANRVGGELTARQGTAVVRFHYDVALDRNGRPVSATFRTRSATDAILPNQPSEIRLTFVGDSVKREAVFADSTNVRMLPAVRGTPFQSPAYGMYEIPFAQMRKTNAQTMTVAIVTGGTGTPGTITLTAGAADTIRSSTGVIYRVDHAGKLLSVDLTTTTQKLVSTRGPGGLDIATIANALRPIGTLSPRGNARASFLQSVVFVDYGRPQVRGRTVWGGVLVPFDTIWRTGANEATHLATSRELTFGNVVVPPGLYTLWVYNSRSDGPQLVINKKVGQWGAGSNSYDPAQDLGRLPMTLANTPEHVEDFTITIRPAGQGRGAIDLAWGDKVATAPFTVRAQ
ncbi:MAG: DUF2911 domain-containing protein [Gemmatimonadota bacterium]